MQWVERGRLQRVAAVAFASLLAASMAGCGLLARPPAEPNILFFLVDDLGWMDLGVQGSELYETPHIDQLAADGARFSRGYAAHPKCGPARYAYLTGRYPARDELPALHGARTANFTPDRRTVADAFRDAGYATFFAGKWQIAQGGAFPENTGFDVNVGGGLQGRTSSHFFPYGDLAHGLEVGEEGEYLADRLTDEAIAFMQQNRDRPFFVYLSHYAVHGPMEVPKHDFRKWKRKLRKRPPPEGPAFLGEGPKREKQHQDDPAYAAMVALVDRSLGRVRQSLEALGIADRTIVVFTSDNGALATPGHNERTPPTSNAPLRGGKGYCYEGGIRVPWIVFWPGVTRGGAVSDIPITGMDLFPTLLQMAGLPPRPTEHVDGVSFAGALLGEGRPAPRELFWWSPASAKLGTGAATCSAVRDGRYKLIEFLEEDRVELYDLSADLGERRNLMDVEPGKGRELLRRLDDWQEAVGANEQIERARAKQGAALGDVRPLGPDPEAARGADPSSLRTTRAAAPTGPRPRAPRESPEP